MRHVFNRSTYIPTKMVYQAVSVSKITENIGSQTCIGNLIWLDEIGCLHWFRARSWKLGLKLGWNVSV